MSTVVEIQESIVVLVDVDIFVDQISIGVVAWICIAVVTCSSGIRIDTTRMDHCRTNVKTLF